MRASSRANTPLQRRCASVDASTTQITDNSFPSLELFSASGLVLAPRAGRPWKVFRDPGSSCRSQLSVAAAGRRRRTGSSAGCTFATRRCATDILVRVSTAHLASAGSPQQTKLSREIYDSSNQKGGASLRDLSDRAHVVARRLAAHGRRCGLHRSHHRQIPHHVRGHAATRRPRRCAARICPRRASASP